ncbi:MAG: hypothetical protein J4478_00070 [Candidatus Diapherotrites archaeon]|uniref:CopG family transcriptional regulator n=1 Tax=Candidatus Iainarchaeum sp. TaxID=3101447 RepID=A0A7J4JUC7_9ARCH|nr:MAG: hypothetical protein QT12_C0023G0005 [archaeon GW2011_AR21]MBS3057784.1 hypothetical protein [Candidatus Diapherotrites archaeon]HIH21391.1 hypothetical protein [Candidatus Diapherotrites archaeon]
MIGKASKLVHLRLSKEMLKEIAEACKEFHYQSPADFLREGARDKLKTLEKQKAFKKIKELKPGRQLSERQINELMEQVEGEERHRLDYFS